MKRITIEQSQKYTSLALLDSGESVWIRRNRTIAEVEAIYQRMADLARQQWNTRCRPLFDQIYKAGGIAHVERYPSSDLWIEYAVTKEHTGSLGLSSRGIQKPENPLNVHLGQQYQHESSVNHTLACRASLFKRVFWRLLDDWLWKDENRPKADQLGAVLRLTINNRLYWFAISVNKHGVLYWNSLLEPTGVVIDKSL